MRGMMIKARDRVLKAFRLTKGNPDRVPIQFDLCRSLLDHFGNKLGIPVRYTDNLYEDVTYRISGNEVRLALGADVVVTGPGSPKGWKPSVAADGTWLNEYGMRMKQGSIYVEVTEYPLRNAQTKADVDAIVWPKSEVPGRYDDLEHLVKEYHDDYFIIGDMEVTIFSLAQQMVGMEKLMMDMAMDEEYIRPLFRACTDFQIEIGKSMVRRGADAFWVGDDFGAQNGLLFSKDMFRDLLKEEYVRLVREVKKEKPDAVAILHCDGAVRELLEDIHEIGFQVFNPVQPGVPGHGPQDLKDAIGDRMCFWGAIDQQQLLPHGTDEELEVDIREKIAVLGKNRGYMISPAHILQPDVSPERVEKFVELCQRYGKY